MSIFYKPSSYKKILKYLRKKDFAIKETGKHAVCKHASTGRVIAIPRHNKLSNGVTEQICKKLVELGYQANEVKKEIIN